MLIGPVDKYNTLAFVRWGRSWGWRGAHNLCIVRLKNHLVHVLLYSAMLSLLMCINSSFLPHDLSVFHVWHVRQFFLWFSPVLLFFPSQCIWDGKFPLFGIFWLHAPALHACHYIELTSCWWQQWTMSAQCVSARLLIFSPPGEHVTGWKCRNITGAHLSPHNRKCLNKDLYNRMTRYYFIKSCQFIYCF